MSTATRTRRINIYINGKQVTNDIKSITAEFNRLRNQTRLLNTDTKEYADNIARMRQLKAIINEHNQSINATRQSLFSLKGIANAFNKYWPMVMGFVGSVTGMIFGIRNATQAFAELEEKITDVMKTTGLSREAVGRLNDEFKKIDTRTPKNELLDLARIAGKLGITAEQDVLGFVRATDKIVVALKTDLGGSAEDAVNTLGKLVEVFNLKQEFGIEGALIKTGSALNELGMASAASEQNIVSFTRRAAGMGKLSDITLPEIMGLAASVDALALSTEVASTAYIMFMGRMTKDTATFATIAGMKLEEFIDLLNTDANEAMLLVLDALGKNEGGFASLAASMGDAGMDGQRAISVISTLAKQVKFIRAQQELATEAFKEGTSVISEFNIKNENAQAVIDKQKKKIIELKEELGEKLMPVYIQGNNLFMTFIKTVGALTEFLFKHGAAIIATVTAITALKIAYKTFYTFQLAAMGRLAAWNKLMLLGSVIHGVFTNNLIKVTTQTKLLTASINNRTLRNGIIWLSMQYWKLTAFIEKSTGATLRATIATQKAAVAQRALNIAQAANPWLLLASVVVAATAALFTYSKLRSKLTEEEKIANEVAKDTEQEYIQQKESLDRLFDALKRYLPGSEERNKIIKELNASYPDLIKNMNLEKMGIEEIETAQRAASIALKDKIKLDIQYAKLTELRMKMAILEQKLANPDANLSGWEKFLDWLSPAFLINLSQNIGDVNQQILALEKTIFFDENKMAFGEKIAEELDKLKILKETLDKVNKGETVTLGKITLPPNDSSIKYLENQIDLIEKRMEVAKAELTLKKGEMDDPVDEMWFNEERKKLQEQLTEGSIKSYEEYQQKLDQLDIDYMKQQLERNNLNAEDRYKLETELFDKLHKKHKENTKSLSLLDVWYYNEKDKLANAYLNGEIKTEDLYNTMLDNLEIEHYKRQLNDAKTTADEKLKIQEKLNSALIQQQQKAQKQMEQWYSTSIMLNPIEKEKNDYQKRLEAHGFFLGQTVFQNELAKQAYIALEQEHAQNLNEIDAGILKDHFDAINADFQLRLSMMKARHTEEMNQEVKSRKVRRSKKIEHLKKEADLVKEHADKVKKLIQDLLDGDTIAGLMFSDGVVSPEEKAQMDAALQWVLDKIAETKEKIDGDFGVATSDILSFSLDQWTKFFKNIDENWENLKWEDKFETIAVGFLAIGDATSKYFKLLAQFEERDMKRFEEMSNKKKDDLSKRLEFGLISQENYNAQIELLDKEMEKKKAVMARDQAKREKVMAIFNATIQGAVAVIKAYATNPILGLAIGAMVASQIATIAATPLPDVPGAEHGGQLVQRSQDGKVFNAEKNPKKRGFVRKPTVIVGENGMEYVVPNEAMNNPTIRPVLQALEMARLNKNLASVNFNDLLFEKIYNGRSQGGTFTDQQKTTALNTNTVVVNNPEMIALLQQNAQLLRELSTKIEKPFTGIVSLYGQNGFYKATEMDNIIKHNANL